MSRIFRKYVFMFGALKTKRLILRLQKFNFKIQYVKSQYNISDNSSCHPFNDAENVNFVEEHTTFIFKFACSDNISINNMKYVRRR